MLRPAVMLALLAAAPVAAQVRPAPGTWGWDFGPLLTFPPHLGALWRTAEGVSAMVSVPLTAQFGPLRYGVFRPHRLVLEPGLMVSEAQTVYVRAGYRYLLHPGGKNVGLGAGYGLTVELAGPAGRRTSISPELVLHLGTVDEPGFATMWFRFEYSGPKSLGAAIGGGASFW